jgi:CheY-like chemotaxis protein/Tfp pilus assembly protein PilZ
MNEKANEKANGKPNGKGNGGSGEPREPAWDPTPPVRPPLGVELTYRSEAALLVAYSTHLVKGQLPIETSSPFASGTPLAIKLLAPSTTINMAGVVAWSRGEPQGPGQPAGMGITLAASAERIGAAIDKLAFEFRGVRALVAASQAAPRALLIRYLRSIITCSVIEVDQGRLAEPGALPSVDLTVIDLDSSGPAGYELYAHLRQHPETGSAPVLAVAGLERDRARAASLGFDEALANPPAFADLEAAALRCLARPIAVKAV